MLWVVGFWAGSEVAWHRLFASMGSGNFARLHWVQGAAGSFIAFFMVGTGTE
jgi:hypothetical protein